MNKKLIYFLGVLLSISLVFFIIKNYKINKTNEYLKVQIERKEKEKEEKVAQHAKEIEKNLRYYETKVEGIQKQFKDSVEIYINIGKDLGKGIYRETEEIGSLGSKYLFLNKDLKTTIPYQKMVDKIEEKSSNGRRNLDASTLNSLADQMNTELISSISTFGGFSFQEKQRLLAAYKNNKNNFNKEFRNTYLKQVSNYRNEKKEDSSSNFINALFDATAGGLCNIVQLLSPAQKFKLANKIVKNGNQIKKVDKKEREYI